MELFGYPSDDHIKYLMTKGTNTQMLSINYELLKVHCVMCYVSSHYLVGFMDVS